jgi:hypothetical protein
LSRDVSGVFVLGGREVGVGGLIPPNLGKSPANKFSLLQSPGEPGTLWPIPRIRDLSHQKLAAF